MLSEKQIQENRETFLNLINSITNPEFSKDALINWLDRKSDFFSAPASTKYHLSCEGGLCQHSLNVYRQLNKLCIMEKLDINDDSIKIVSLLHDISKANFYEKYYRNVKDDQTGQWTKVLDYKVREDKFILGSHEQNSEYMVHSFYPLTVEESAAILHHMGGKSWDSAQDDIPAVYNKYSLAVLLHTADMLATYLDEQGK